MVVPILKDGDKVNLPASWSGGVQVLSPAGPQPLKGSGKATLKGKKVVLESDLDAFKVSGASYQRGGFMNGKGDITIVKKSTHLTAQSTCDGEPMGLFDKGYMAMFTVTTPAMQDLPNGGKLPDPAPTDMGKGTFTRAPEAKIQGT